MSDKEGSGGLALIAAAALVVAAAALRDKSGPDRQASDPHVRRLEPNRGRNAAAPTAIPSLGWRDILWRTYEQLNKDRVMLVAAGVTFYGLLALFPALAAFVSIYGFFADPRTVVGHVATLSDFLPEGAVDIIGDQMERIANQPTERLSLGFALGLGISLWSANNGMKALFDAMNVAYGEEEDRGFIRLNALSLLFTLGAILVVLLAVGAIVVVPIVLGLLGLGGASETVIQIARWPLLLLIIAGALGLIYRYGPSRTRASWQWIWPGTILAAAASVVASLLFSWYVANFDSYNETYGSLGAIIAFMVWMWLSATIIIMGAEINAEIEHQTARDSTVKGGAPMGTRGAEVADRLGRPAAG